MKRIQALAISSALLIVGGVLGRGLTLQAASRTRYCVVPATSAALEPTALWGGYRSLVDAEAEAHRLLASPETEQERGQAVLILDEAGRLVDVVP